jgi:hypothetical protein
MARVVGACVALACGAAAADETAPGAGARAAGPFEFAGGLGFRVAATPDLR